MLAKEIISKDNEKIKFLRKLGQKKYRNKEGMFFIENLKIIHDGLESKFYPESLFITEDFLNKNKKQVNNILLKSGLEYYYLINEAVNKSFSALDTPSGICAIYKKQERKIKFSAPIVYLNAINDPGNLGTILRSALAFGFKNIILDERCADLYSPKVINSAKDSVLKLNIELDKKFVLLKKIKKEMKVFSTRLDGGEKIDGLNKEMVFCLVLGSESHGISKEVEKLSDNFIKIDMSYDIESLNVAISAGIIFHNYYINS
jgi:RNA methyltransferase, TrmH family